MPQQPPTPSIYVSTRVDITADGVDLIDALAERRYRQHVRSVQLAHRAGRSS